MKSLVKHRAAVKKLSDGLTKSFVANNSSSLWQWMTLTVDSQSPEIFTWQSTDDRASLGQEVYLISLTRRLVCHLVVIGSRRPNLTNTLAMRQGQQQRRDNHLCLSVCCRYRKSTEEIAEENIDILRSISAQVAHGSHRWILMRISLMSSGFIDESRSWKRRKSPLFFAEIIFSCQADGTVNQMKAEKLHLGRSRDDRYAGSRKEISSSMNKASWWIGMGLRQLRWIEMINLLSIGLRKATDAPICRDLPGLESLDYSCDDWH